MLSQTASPLAARSVRRGSAGTWVMWSMWSGSDRTGQTPLDRRLAGRRLRRPSPAELHEAFLWSETRLVTKTCSVSLYGNHYEVDPALVGVRVELVFDPFDLTDIEVRYQDRPMGHAVPRHIGRHTHPAARPEAAPPPSGAAENSISEAAASRQPRGVG
jgi:putative transposase